MARSVTVVERDGNVVHLLAQASNGEAVEAITTMTREGDTLTLSGLHVQGSGPGALGPDAVGELRALARELGRQEGVRTVLVSGGVRTTGAGAAALRSPRVIRIEIA